MSEKTNESVEIESELNKAEIENLKGQLESSLQMIAILEVALEKIAEDFGTDYADGNVLIAHDALASLNTWRKNGG